MKQRIVNTLIDLEKIEDDMNGLEMLAQQLRDGDTPISHNVLERIAKAMNVIVGRTKLHTTNIAARVTNLEVHPNE